MLSQSDVLLRLLTSVVLGGLIGLEREIQRRVAGLRTHILVCLGSTLIMLTSIYIFDIYKAIGNLDPGRIAAGVVTGIGFIGAGAIIKDNEGIKGLTTAASIWIVSAIGLCIGCGFLYAGYVTTILVLMVLLILRRVEHLITKNK
ncbi:MAG: MgtC/SapB family protein [Candidatus Omnitrophota bacterium]|nr:MgtC/SapB family protein [Candidatus Omnitrophota bacterium]